MHRSPTGRPLFKRHGFTLLELLVVIALLGLLMALLVPAIGSFKGSGQLSKASADLAGVFEQARAYAMSQNTYVYVGLQEVDGVNPGAGDGVGKLAVAAVASKSGQRPTNVAADTVAISKALTLDGAHLTNSSALGSSGNMQRPGSASTADLSGAGSAAAAAFRFTWPPGSAPKYSFSKVIEFDPQGVARVPTNTATQSLQPFIEIGLVPARGNTPLLSSNQAVIQINGITGTSRIYRP